MSSLREAAQQALEFCEFLWRDVPLNDYSEDMRQDVESALRAALAEQCKCGDRPADKCPGEWEPGCDLGENEEHAVVAEQDEPVAWLTPRTLDSYARPDLGYETASKTDYGAFPVYAHPAPQRQPLRTITYVCPICAASLERQE